MIYRNFFFIFLLTPFFLTAQIHLQPEFGKPLGEELNMTTYAKDPKADAVVLYERGNYEFAMDRGIVVLVKNVYRKIKILNEKAKDLASVSLYTYYSGNKKEKISNVRAATSNAQRTIFVSEEDYHYKHSDNHSELVFTFPDVQKGSVLEYEYTITTPFYFNLDGWRFQNKFPTVYSEFHAEIPGYFKYNRTLVGNHKLKVNNAEIKKKCFYPTSLSIVSADCEVLTYAMQYVPAFKEEDYMLSLNNYIARIDFQLEETLDIDGGKTYYTKSWETVDKEFKSDKNIGKQARKNNYFKNRLPEHIVNISNKTERAKAVYSYIQNHYTWSGSYRFFQNVDVKEAFDKKSGSISEINLALVNALNAADIDTNFALLSTRDNGIPTKNYAVISDFNYLVAHLNLEGQSIFLDATDKHVPFGMLPYRCLNYEVRVMDFKEGSYWETVVPETKNITYINTQIHVDESGNLVGRMRETNTGYKAIDKRKALDNAGREDYIREKETLYTDLGITSYKHTDKEVIDKPITEDYEFTISNNAADLLVFNPFIVRNYSQNPFQLDERTYPVDFGYPAKFTYLLSLDLAGYYTLSELPENKAVKFPENAGEASVVYSLNGNTLQMRFSFELNETHFEPHNYQALKSFFDMVVEVQNNTPLVLNKVE